MDIFLVDELVLTSKSQHEQWDILPIYSLLEGDVLINCNTY